MARKKKTTTTDVATKREPSKYALAVREASSQLKQQGNLFVLKPNGKKQLNFPQIHAIAHQLGSFKTGTGKGRKKKANASAMPVMPTFKLPTNWSQNI